MARQDLHSDLETAKALSEAAEVIFESCVEGPVNQGGVIGNLGVLKKLAIRIVSYRPTVQCSNEPGGRGPPSASCRGLIDHMPATYNHQIFGPRHAEGVEVGLPKSFMEGEMSYLSFVEPPELIIATAVTQECVITADSVGNPTEATWYMIYLAAVAIDVMCVRRGLAGNATHIGLSKSLLP